MERSLQHPCGSIPGFACLEELALDLIWSWNHATDKIWQHIDADLWERTHNPWVVLQNASKKCLEVALSDPEFTKMIQNLNDARKRKQQAGSWFQKQPQSTACKCIAYFSMEYMLSEALPIYSGGLGNVAGDQLKAASDLGVPVVAIGLLYQQGYFRQVIDQEGVQHAFYPFNSPEQLPITPLRKANGERLRFSISLCGWTVWLRTWEVRVGNARLLLLDSNDAVNYPPYRGITSELYGGDTDLRLQQELILGMGGWRLLEELGITPEVCHLNEGHAAFVILERIRAFMKKNDVPFDVALNATRSGNIFTTHTAVSAGFDRFPSSHIERYLTKYSETELKISIQDLLALGRQNPNNSEELFNMAFLSIRGSAAVNGVSALHERVSKWLFQPLFPRWPQAEVPIGHVTNGIHVDTWTSMQAEALWCKYSQKERWCSTTEQLEVCLKNAPDEQIWQMRNEAKSMMIRYGRERVSRIWKERGLPDEEVERAKTMFNPDALTLGFARRFATYKRPNMLLHNPERLIRILTNPDRPVQLILAGKAHPADLPGQALIKEWIHFVQRPNIRSHVIFLNDYDMLMTQNLARGVDVWINTPRRPWEACGTSGMKMLVNGGLNLSELDGWWAEAYTKEVGWALGDGEEHGNDPSWDAHEANQLYDLLEFSIIPEFYTRNKQGIPTAWVSRVRKSMSQLTPRFSANRSVREYTEKFYLPAAIHYQARAQSQAKLAQDITAWKKLWKNQATAIRFATVAIKKTDQNYLFQTSVDLGGIDKNSIKIELFASGETPFIQELRYLRMNGNLHYYELLAPATRPSSDYTLRAIPFFPGVAVPLELPIILWQK